MLCSCGFLNPVGVDLCQRPTPKGGRCSRTLKRNGLSRRHALDAAYLTPTLDAIEAEGGALTEQSIADAGGRSELTAREVSQHEYRGLLHVRIRKLALALDTHGDFDKRGRLRGAWVDRLRALIETARQVDSTLGLQRRTKRIDPRERLLQAMRPEAGE